MPKTLYNPSISAILIIVLVIVGGCSVINPEPKVGDCVDVTKYGLKNTERYCKVTSVEKFLDNPNVWTIDLQDGCQFFLCESIPPDLTDRGCNWYPLRRVNTLDAKLVSKSLCS